MKLKHSNGDYGEVKKAFCVSKIVIFATESLNDVDQEIKSELLDKAHHLNLCYCSHVVKSYTEKNYQCVKETSIVRIYSRSPPIYI